MKGKMKKTYYGYHLDCVDGIPTFETRKEAEESRKIEIEEGPEPMGEDEIGEVYEIQMTEEEFKKLVDV